MPESQSKVVGEEVAGTNNAELGPSLSTSQDHNESNINKEAAPRSEEVPISSTPTESSSNTAVPPAPEPTTPQPPSAYPQPNHAPSKSVSKSSLPPARTISSHLISHPTHSAGKAMRTVFPQPNPLMRLIRRFKVKHSIIHGLSEDERLKWEAQGKGLRERAGWVLDGEDEEEGKVKVTPLFWQMYLSLMPTLQRDPLAGLVPPDLLGSTTTMPLSIISLIPDIMQHYRDVIIRAEKEVFLATNYWQPSNSVNTISQSLRDLSAKVLKANRPKVVVKVMYDRGSWEQLWNAHAFVKKAEWAPLDLPSAHEVEGLELEVINFHKVLLGTFHAKFLVVDRKVVLLNSNNIQDRPNLELMTHLEGPIVDSFYEIALHSWYNKLTPPLPCMSKPYEPPRDFQGRPKYLFQEHNPYFDDIEILKAAKAARILLRRQTKDIAAENEHQAKDRFRDIVRKAVTEHRNSLATWAPGEELEAKARDAMKELREFREKWGLAIGASRASSRRPSQTELGATHFQDDQTAAITAANAHLTLPTDPSEVASSPTLNGDQFPIKSKTYPLPGKSDNDSAWEPDQFSKSNGNGHAQTGRLNEKDFASHEQESTQPRGYSQPDHHVMFAPSADVKNGGHTGRIIDDSESGNGLVDSPTASSVRLPETALSKSKPTSPISPLAVSNQDDITNANGSPLPLTARMSNEVPRTRGFTEGLSSDTSGKVTENTGDTKETSGKKVVIADDDEIPEGKGTARLYQMSKRFNATGVLSEAWATVEDSDDLDTFRPHVVHAPHDPFPIAMCCRKPHGLPGHHDIRNPQNAAWLAGFRYAQKKVFIQTPTLNARPIVRAIKQTCRRGVDVVLLLDLGFNDKGESIPFQGGTNEQVVDRLYKKLAPEGKEKYLKVYWYTGKDQVRPLNAVKKQRNCHIKFAAYDDQVLIIGNGNQDSQSWFHSQEVNVMIDSKQIVAEMMETLLSNQNTTKYGLVGPDGVWRDEEGKTLVDYGATSDGKYQGLAGFIQFAKTI